MMHTFSVINTSNQFTSMTTNVRNFKTNTSIL